MRVIKRGQSKFIPTSLHRRRSGRHRFWLLRVEMAVDLETDGKNDDLQDESANVKNTIDPHTDTQGIESNWAK